MLVPQAGLAAVGISALLLICTGGHDFIGKLAEAVVKGLRRPSAICLLGHEQKPGR